MPESPHYLPALVPDFRLRADKEKPRPRNLPTTGTDWPEWVENALFICWIEEDQVMPAALARLHAEWDAFVEPQIDPETGEILELEPPEIPLPTALSWLRRHEWKLKAAQLIAATFPQLEVQHAAQLVHAKHLALRRVIDILKKGDRAKDADALKAAELLLVAGGSGTHGSKDRLAPIPREVVSRELDMAGMTEEELAEVQLKIIREGKAQLPERRK